MLTIKNQTPERLVLGSSRPMELGGIFMVGAGLMLQGVWVQMSGDSFQFLELPIFGVMLIFGGFFTLSVDGVWEFEKPTLQITRKRLFRPSFTRSWLDVEGVEYLALPDRGYFEISLCFRGGQREHLATGDGRALEPLAHATADFLGVPLEARPITEAELAQPLVLTKPIDEDAPLAEDDLPPDPQLVRSRINPQVRGKLPEPPA
ncbi:MAG: hypothetical protein HY291_24420 [Planctomycetes bacterium]|nr:hypothetical protein [Planctomycetota bacterium]